MNVISIDAPCNGSGKTSLILSILSAFPNTFAFTKFTTIYGDEQFCPAKDHDCACHRLRGDYNICTDAEALSRPGPGPGIRTAPAIGCGETIPSAPMPRCCPGPTQILARSGGLARFKRCGVFPS